MAKLLIRQNMTGLESIGIDEDYKQVMAVVNAKEAPLFPEFHVSGELRGFNREAIVTVLPSTEEQPSK